MKRQNSIHEYTVTRTLGNSNANSMFLSPTTPHEIKHIIKTYIKQKNTPDIPTKSYLPIYLIISSIVSATFSTYHLHKECS